mgnify:CR=1 FL=1
MAIYFDEKNKVFNLQTKNTSYIFAVIQDKYLFHMHYGKKVSSVCNVEEYARQFNMNYATKDSTSNGVIGDYLPQEFSTFGSADYRKPTFHAQYENGGTVSKFSYKGYKIYGGKPALSGLPATYAESDSEATTLEIYLKDEYSGLEATLLYTVFEEIDAIARSIQYKNSGKAPVHLKSVLSMSVDFVDKDFDFVHLPGSWARERMIEKIPLGHAKIEMGSNRGTTSHIRNNFYALSRKNATEDAGDVYGFSLVYSGNFEAGVDVCGQSTARAYIGISSFDFDWTLNEGDTFQTPEAVMVYSDEGFGKMSRIYHKLYRTRLCRGKYRDEERPVLINNWEATYFDFNEEKILKIAEKAKSAGIDLMVLDDGWFGKRNSDNCSLGDWVEDKNKLPDGMGGLAKKVNDMGMKFGLWFEPEMISEDSDLYRAHPDWHIHVSGRPCSLGRRQMVLDLSRKDVCDYIISAVSAMLKKANISYVKWDMNRYISEFGSSKLPADRQGEFAHRYVLGLYHVLEELTKAFPDVLIEGCSGGGGRFDPGMLYYSPQIWTSDDTDAIERMYIQHGTSLVYPSMSMGAHVSAVPNHQVKRVTPISLRGNVAMAGQFGYELDLNKLPEEEFEEVKHQVAFYKSIRETVHQGDMYRIRSPFDYDAQATSWEFISGDKKQAVLFYYTMHGKANPTIDFVKLRGLDDTAVYVDAESGKEYTGDFLKNIGIPFKNSHDYESKVIVFNKK